MDFELDGRQRRADLDDLARNATTATVALLQSGDRRRKPARSLLRSGGVATSRSFRVEGGSNVQVQISPCRRITSMPLRLRRPRPPSRVRRFIDFSLYSLPIQTQAVYSGAPDDSHRCAGHGVHAQHRSASTRSEPSCPCLSRLRFARRKLLWGVFLFTILVATGPQSIRFLLERLRLLLVPRLERRPDRGRIC